MNHAQSLHHGTSAIWRLLQALTLAAAGALFAGLAWYPERSLELFWKAVVPLLPATFLLSPSLWRNLCPLASCNEIAATLGARRPLPMSWAPRASALGAGWLVVAIALRRPLLDSSAAATGLLLVGAGALAIALGLRFARKSGFCNSLCPILPVERFYGQRPLLQIGNARCASCEACTLVGCVDLVPRRSLAIGIGRRRSPLAWMLSPVGALVGAFPGIIVAYFTLTSAASWLDVTTRFAGCAAVSLVATALLSARVRDRSVVTRALAAVSALTYYAFATAPWAAAVGLSAWAVPLQALALTLVAAWSWKALRTARA